MKVRFLPVILYSAVTRTSTNSPLAYFLPSLTFAGFDGPKSNDFVAESIALPTLTVIKISYDIASTETKPHGPSPPQDRTILTFATSKDSRQLFPMASMLTLTEFRGRNLNGCVIIKLVRHGRDEGPNFGFRYLYHSDFVNSRIWY